MSHDLHSRAGKSAEFFLGRTIRILGGGIIFIRGSQTQDLASVSSVRTTEFEVRNLNTVVRFHHTPFILSESSSAWLECVLWEYDVAGSNPVFPMPNGFYTIVYMYMPFRLNSLSKVVES